ncbi:MAG: S8 family serine peptidase, partial [Candidatus Cloacimonetes bacterium]|nr:S8 family serine peptidase [Candidatus Cloacimonadota bacterium]
MKKVIFLSFWVIFLYFISVINAQTSNNQEDVKFKKNRKSFQNRGMLDLKSRAVEFKKEEFLLDITDKTESKKVYLKLKSPITKNLKNKLKKYGVTLINYVSDNTYIVELNEDKFQKLKGQFSVYGFAEIDPADKMTEQLYKQRIPAYAKDGDYIKVTVSVFDDVSFEEAVSEMRSLGCRIESNNFSRSHKLKIYVKPSTITNLAELEFVKYIEEISPPAMPNNINAGKLSNVFWDNDGNTISGLFEQDFRESPPVPYGFKGDGINVAVKDCGKIYAHSDLYGRLTIAENDYVSDHATHVAGTIGATLSLNDNDGNTGGMAELANIISFSVYIPFSHPIVPTPDTDYAEDLYTALIQYNAPISNNSWGLVVGWGYYVSGNYLQYRWEDNIYLFGNYTSDTQDFDEFIYDYYDNDALVLKSAGNDRGDYDITDPDNHDGVLYDDEYYYCILPISSAKNIITVGALGVDENETIISDFSSFGPTDDGRVKPDLVADGFELYSTIKDNAYDYKDGTSMSCPVVTGICALIHEAYEYAYGEYPTADIVKALLCNYAEDLGNPGPDFSYGFGLVDAKASIDAVLNYDGAEGGHIVKGVIGETGDYLEYQFDILADLYDNESITLVWIDPPGNPSVDNAIVNDLDVYVVYNDNETNVYYPFYFKEYDDFNETESTVDPTENAKNDGLFTNRYDTVEQVVLFDKFRDNIPAGEYKIVVYGRNISSLNQPFALVTSIGFKGLTFNTLKVRGAGGEWISNQFAVLDINPDVLLMVTDLDNESLYPITFEYKYSNEDNNGEPIWCDNWLSVDGVYTDGTCTEECSSPYYGGVAYVKVEGVAFENVSTWKNKIKFRLSYKGEMEESPEYIVKNNNVYYVSQLEGSDNYGKGTIINPWQSIGYAIMNSVSTEQVPAIIKVQGGTYNEDISLNNFTYLYGGYDENWYRDIDSNETIIYGSDNSHVVVLALNAIFDGFTVENGNADLGGGIYSVYDNVTIKNCIIKNCSAQRGGGLYIKGNSINIIDCMIEDNTAQLGGGGYLEDFEGTLQSCIFNNNTANTGLITTDYYHMYNYYNRAHGGGLFFVYSEVIIDHCSFKSNRTTSIYSNGGCIFTLRSSDSIISNSIFENNCAAGSQSKQEGGAIYCHDTSAIKILGSLFYENEAKQGGAIYAWNITLTNCMFYANVTNDNRTYPENVSSAIHVNSGTHNIYNCILLNNTSNYGDRNYSGTKTEIRYSCVDDNTFTGTGTIHDNPQFKDPSNGDFSLKITSPCIDAGYDIATGLNLLSEDIAKNPRVFEFDSSKTNSVDMGAYEYRWNFTQASENDGKITLEWESLDNDTYYVYYTDHTLTGTISPVLHYKMNDDNDSIVTESINSYNGLFMDNEGEINTEDYSNEGKINTTLSFNGNRYVDCGNRGNITSDISITAWV